ncbi:hypothetical protein FF80_01928 [Devosia sp. LC5]|uniref:hypothetical protein n=1 Tax=Devosia sp. LC5 TaxID=1502724 RepID=UPI0004E3E7AF|nr:hypothetical protein [Devosia sp. LC5]KFC68204.1 hypothetical protein FF80_01928 [Devosia sp. LC5]
MTYPSSSGAAASNKPHFLSATTSPIAIASGLVQHDLVSPTDQVMILSLIEETGSASVGDVMAALDGHVDPAGAIQVLISAGIVKADLRSGVLDQHTMLTRTVLTDPDDDPTPAAPGGILPAPGGLPDGIVALSVTSLQPNVLVSSGSARRALGRAGSLRRPGVYILLSGAQAYVGMGSEVGRRVANGAQPIADVDAIITITDIHDGLSEADALVLERIIHGRVAAAREVALVNGTPDGAAVSPERYEELNLFAAMACHALAREGYLFVNLSPRLVLAGPRAEAGRLAPLRAFDEAPEGEVMELSFGKDHMALACRRADDEWVLLRGSDIRLDCVASANASVSYLRAAWHNAGILELAHDGTSYVLSRDMVFSSASAAMHFTVGSKGQGRGGWQPIDTGLSAPAR